jgi:polysaccharide transporter, PST family
VKIFVDFFEGGHKRKLIKNFVSLSALQAVNYLMPLITVPYLVRVLGPEKFGLVAFAQAFMQYFVLFTDYGFNFSATKEISIHKADKNKVSEIFTSVFWLKAAFTAGSFALLMIIVMLFAKFRGDWFFYACNFGVVFGNALFFSWLFQGLEKMPYITILNFFAKLVFLFSIFLFVKAPSDYVNMAILYSAGYLVAGVLSIYITFVDLKVRLHRPNFGHMKREFMNGYHVFVAQLAASLYTTSNIFILGLLTNNTLVGYYSGAEKLIKAIQALFLPVSQTIFPHISELASRSKEAAMTFVRKVTVMTFIGFLLISILTYVFADKMVYLVLGQKYAAAIPVLKILAFLPLICNLGNIFGTQVMINFGLSAIMSRVVIFAGILDLGVAIIATLAYKEIGLAYSVIGTELFITVALYWMLLKNKLPIFGKRF